MSNFYFTDDQGQQYPILRSGSLSLGDYGADVNISHPNSQIIPRHATLLVTDKQVMIKPDAGLIAINGNSVTALSKLQVGDAVTVGNIRLTLRERAKTAPPPPSPPAPNKSQPSKATTAPASSFDLGDSAFDNPTPPAPPIVSTSSARSVIPVPPKSHPLVPTSPINTPPPPANTTLTDEDCKQVLNTFFDGAYIYSENKSGNTLTFNQRLKQSRSWLSTTFIMLDEGIKWLHEQQRKQVRSADYVDQAIRQMVLSLIPVAQNEMGMLSTLREPLVIYGPIFWRASGIPIKHICARKGDDGYVRFSAQKVSVLLLDQDMIGIYTCHLDTMDKRVGYYQNAVYNYRDITSITDQDTVIRVEMDGGLKEVTAHAFRIVVPGDDLTITLNSPAIRDMFEADAALQPEHKQSLNVIRQLWLDKKRNP
jgi:hypothetical protein